MANQDNERLIAPVHIKTLATVLYQGDGYNGIATELGRLIARHIGQFGGHFIRVALH